MHTQKNCMGVEPSASPVTYVRINLDFTEISADRAPTLIKMSFVNPLWFSVLPGAPVRPSAWWPGAVCPCQSRRPPPLGADLQMRDECSHTLPLSSHTVCPFQSRVHLQRKATRQRSPVLPAEGGKHRGDSPTTKMILASLILSVRSRKNGQNGRDDDLRGNSQNIIYDRPLLWWDTESDVHVFPISL